MMRSMTGYGVGSYQTEAIVVSVEVRTVNHRFLDVHLRLPKEYAALEPDIHRAVRGSILRGRVDISFSIKARRPADVRIDTELAQRYWKAAEQIRSEFQLGDSLDLSTLISLPGVVESREVESPKEGPGEDSLRQAMLESLRQAIEGVLRMRAQEGEVLRADMSRHLVNIDHNTRQVRLVAPQLPLEYRQRLEERLARLLPQDGVDPQRLAQEVALLAEKSDIAEELARLESHVDQFAGWMKGGEEVGKKMDFLLQEMQREVNTILSKSANLEVTKYGIAMKADIEKLREQTQNIE